MKAHDIKDDEGRHLATVIPAKGGDVADLLRNPIEEDQDGRSAWVWVTLANGDVMLATFPQGETFEDGLQRGIYNGD
jgi:hypothetical protein